MNYEERKIWLDSLNVGDSVAYPAGWYDSYYKIEKISKITPTRKFVVGNIMFNSDGRSNKDIIEPVTDKIKLINKRYRLKTELHFAYQNDLLNVAEMQELNQLEVILKLLQDRKQNEEKG